MAKELLPNIIPTKPVSNGPLTPVGILIVGLSGVNIVEVVELRSSPDLPELDWHGLSSLFSRTLLEKMPHLAIRETFFICKILLITIIFLSFSLFLFLFSFFFPWVSPPTPRGFFARSMFCFKSSFCSKIFSVSFSTLSNVLGGFGCKVRSF